MDWPVCPIKALTGLCCPGCGGFRMVLALFDGRFADAVRYNAVALVFVALYAWVAVAWVLRRVRGRAVTTWLDWQWARVAAVAALVLWSAARNVPGTGLYV
ncbi:DUF2752 domain-containing protein [Actinokineospora cianjurensis]|uniref:Uncharacterized protein DUF2752 n=1 Tax=Actinokineospora cianjurensis TaxID=585224 RepID=A0A421AZK7_9PSEU|nr:DUF2752 domain-containing protein [Actinokineospora cianjurensis]RLK55250.1 uncharacterized protein DUF2752 [Actinokineospora cianjurensis]